MKNVFYILTIISVCLYSTCAFSQAPSRRNMKQKNNETSELLSVRAQSQYTSNVDIPSDLKWKRDIYRNIDLEKEENTGLYYPDRPIGDKMNLFSTIFKLAIEKKIKIYEYNIDGNEQFDDASIINPKDMLDRFSIYYREKLVNNRRDTVIVIDNSDIPSNEVKSFFVKEVNYFDDRASTYNSTIEALCPVLHRSDEFTMEITKYPMFWVKYKDVEPYLSQSTLMASDYNNVSNMTVADFFASKMYKGDIYKTTNRLNRTLAQYCPNDSTLKAEQEKIEKQLVTFENNLWGINPQNETVNNNKEEEAPAESDQTDENATSENSKRVGRDNSSDSSKEEKRSSSSSKKEVKQKRSSSTSKASVKAAPRASVRRERR